MHNLRKRCKNNTSPISTKRKYCKLKKGHGNQPIVLLELLWYRCYVNPLLSDKHLPNDFKCREIAKTTPQLKHKLSEIEIVSNELNVGVRHTPKRNYKIAGRGIE